MPRRLNSEKAKGIIKPLIKQLAPQDIDDNDNEDLDFDLDVQIGYARPQIKDDKKNIENDDDIPDHIKLALFLARQSAVRNKKGA